MSEGEVPGLLADVDQALAVYEGALDDCRRQLAAQLQAGIPRCPRFWRGEAELGRCCLRVADAAERVALLASAVGLRADRDVGADWLRFAGGYHDLAAWWRRHAGVWVGWGWRWRWAAAFLRGFWRGCWRLDPGAGTPFGRGQDPSARP